MGGLCSCWIWTCGFVMMGCLWADFVTGLDVGFSKIQHSTATNGGTLAFLVVGDWGRGGAFNQSQVANKLSLFQMGDIGKKLNIDFVISTGDNFYHKGLKSVADPFFRKSFTNIYTAKSLQKPWYTVLGNHDYQGNTGAQLSRELKKIDRRWNCKRNFIVRAGVADIIFIDTTPFVNTYFDNPKEQRFDWSGIMPRDEYLSSLKRNLDLSLKTSLAPWKIVVGHHAIRSIGYHGDTHEIVDQLLPILEANKVDMYINGHDHCLEHLSNQKGLMQFLTSGGGSKAWKNKIHYELHSETTHFYYDGEGFISVELIWKKAYITFFDVMEKPMYGITIKP
ncbi:purple acid phosphatase [Striga asiatica]|uniref:Purple acid phosphatase n=1 Tax=Striga asiatica TaxID=4170 RepID=A0A5A7R8A2_STRAF|nr:purple acid phosphatase [Striga asiatica]